MKCGVGAGVVLSLLGCAGPRAVSELPGQSVVPLTAPGAAPAVADAATEEASAAASLETEEALVAPAFPLVAHEYRRVYEGWSFLLLLDPVPYLITGDGAVNLATGKIDFERDGSNWAAYQGDSVWFGDGFSPMSACPEPSTLVQRVGGKWVPRLEMNAHSLVVQPWVKGSSLAAIVPFRSGPPWGYELTVLERNRTAPRAARKSAHHLPECETRIAWLQTLVAFPSGEIFAFGSECEHQPLPEQEPEPLPDEIASNAPRETDSEDDSIDPDRVTLPPNVMETWRNGRHEFIEVPLREVGQVIGVGPNDMWATGTRADETWALAHFDGVSWQVLPEYYDHAIAALRVYPGESGREARRLILSTRQLLEVNHGVTSEHALPSDCVPNDVTLDGEELWISCSTEGPSSLHTTRTDIAEFRFPLDEPDRKLVSFTGKAYPRLDPKGPSLRSCGSPEHQTPRPLGPLNRGSKPLPSSVPFKSKLTPSLDDARGF